MKHLTEVFDKLGLTKERGLFLFNENEWQGTFTNRVERLLLKVIKPDAFFCIDNKPFILFFDNPKNKRAKLEQIWNFNESPIVIINYIDSVEIFNGFDFLHEKGTLDYFGNEKTLNDFSYFELVTGSTWEKYHAKFNQKNRVDYQLLRNVEATQKKLQSLSVSREVANSLLGKIIFVRYLIDRGVRLDLENKGSRKWTKEEFSTLLQNRQLVIDFFNYLKKKFNGDLFQLSDDEVASIPQNAFDVIIKMLSGDDIDRGQKSLFDLYDFSILPVEFVSNVYELFIGKDKQEKEGAYYTPLFLVDYILNETVGEYLINNVNTNCRVLDPACGSGIFLVETLRKLIGKYIDQNPEVKSNSVEFKEAIKKLATHNLFGVDKDQSAVEVAIFSIYLTLLDYQEPSDIESFQFPKLFGQNFYQGDFFNEKLPFNAALTDKQFSFILGNPPWKRGKGPFVKYITNRRKNEKTKGAEILPNISNGEIAQAFILRVSDFCSVDTKVSLIVTSKVLYNLKGIGFRQYFLDQFFIHRVFELAPVRREVFDKSNDKAIAPAAVLFYQYANGKNTDNQVIEHLTLKPSRFFSLFKVFAIHRGDFKKIIQARLKEFDYLWKVLVYGNYLDFNFIRRLKEDYQSINDKISNDCMVGQGIQGRGSDEYDVSEHLGKKQLNPRRDIKPFWVNPNPKKIWKNRIAHRARNPKLFEAPMLLISKGVNSHLRAVSTVCYQNLVFTDSITSVKSNDDESSLLVISGLLNSDFFSYWGLTTFSSIGIEREQAHNPEKFSLPFSDSKELESVVTELMTSLNSEQNQTILEPELEKTIDDLSWKLNKSIEKILNMTELETDLVDYAYSITIPMIMRRESSNRLPSIAEPNDSLVNEYIDVFKNRFQEVLEVDGKTLITTVRWTKQLIGIFFKVVPIEEKEPSTRREKPSSDSFMKLIFKLGNEKITDRLFIQKDIRGFEEDGFYIIKPNEKRLWHRAVAHVDVNEFVDAILKTGKRELVNA